MKKVCNKQDCQNKVAFSCNCKVNTYLCHIHLGEHLMTKGSHENAPIFYFEKVL